MYIIEDMNNAARWFAFPNFINKLDNLLRNHQLLPFTMKYLFSAINLLFTESLG